MTTNPYAGASTAGSSANGSQTDGEQRSGGVRLRLWPAILCLLGIFVMPRIPALIDGPSLPVMMVSFMSPALFGIVLFVWWGLASRATVRERRMGAIGIVLLGAVGLFLLDSSMHGFGVVMQVLPGAAAAFGLAVVVMATSPRFRLPAALIAMALALGYWDSVRSNGVTGRFQPELAWRWKPIAEEEYLRGLAKSSANATTAPGAKSLSENPRPGTPGREQGEGSGGVGIDSKSLSEYPRPGTPGRGQGEGSGGSWIGSKSSESSSALSSAESGSSELAERLQLESAAWPAFRGASRDGKRPGVRLVEDWKASAPREVWRVPVGPGWSSFSIAGNRLWTQEQRGANEAVVCLSADTGQPIWAHEYPGRFSEAISGAGPRATPTLDAQGVFALGANGDLMRLDPVDGRVIWKVDLKQDADRSPPTWGFSASPLVVDGKVIVHAGGKEDRGVLAYDVESGQRVWGVASGDHSYSSAQLATFDGVTGALMVTNHGLQFLDVTDGQEIWHYDWPIENYRVLQPLVVGNTVLLAATLGDGTRSLSVSRQGSDWQVTENWKTRELKPDFNDFVEHRGHIYGFDANILTCVDLSTGKRTWKKGRYGNGQLVLLPDGDQLVVTSETGELVLVRATSERWEELGRVPAVEGKTWNHPVVDGHRVYVRNGQEAACFELATQ